MKQMILPLIACVFLVSCKTTYTRTFSTPMFSPSATINPIRADVDVDMNKKLSGNSTATYFLMFRVSRQEKKFANGMNFTVPDIFPLPGLKAAAAYKAVVNGGADIIVHPNYVVEKENYLFFKIVRLKVNGYAGYFKKFYQEPYDKNKADLKLDIKANGY